MQHEFMMKYSRRKTYFRIWNSLCIKDPLVTPGIFRRNYALDISKIKPKRSLISIFHQKVTKSFFLKINFSNFERRVVQFTASWFFCFFSLQCIYADRAVHFSVSWLVHVFWKVFLSAYTEKARLFFHYQILIFSGGRGGQGFNSSVAVS